METAETRKARLQCDSGTETTEPIIIFQTNSCQTCVTQADTVTTNKMLDKMMTNLHSGISVLGSEESLMGKRLDETFFHR